MSKPTGATCTCCTEPTAMICQECMRAAALGYWDAVVRHPETIRPGDVVCVFCGAGVASFCPMCFPGYTAEYAATLGRMVVRFADGRRSATVDELDPHPRGL